MRNRKSFLTLGIIVLVLFLGVGYAVVSSVYLNIGGTANVANSELKVEITNVEAKTNMTDKTLDFTNVLSNNNLTSNFTLKNMSLNELVTITYTVTNNEKDVDAIISAIDGVDLNNSNSDCFDVNYQITDNETDLENNDKTMEVVVTVELIKTPLNDDESTTNVGLTLAAIPKGVDPSTIKPPSGISDVLDNVWPIEWNTLEVMNNTNLFDGNLVRISGLTPSISEFQYAQIDFSVDGNNITLYYYDVNEQDSGDVLVFSDSNPSHLFYMISVFEAGEIVIENETIYVTEPGLYTFNYGIENIDIDIIFRKRDNLVKFGQKYYITTFLKQDARSLEYWITFNEDGTLMQQDSGVSLPSNGYTYSGNLIYNSELEESVTGDITISDDGKYITFGNLSTPSGMMFVVESEYNDLKSIPLKFGLKYICTIDNVNNGRNIGEYVIGFADGSGMIGRVNGRIDYMPFNGFSYTSTQIVSSFLPSGSLMQISNDGNTLTQVNSYGEVMYVYSSGFENDLPINYDPENIVNNASVFVDGSVVGNNSLENIKFTKFANAVHLGFMINSEAQIDGSARKVIPYDSIVSKEESAFIIKYSNDTIDFYAIVVPTAGEYFGTTFSEAGIYGSDLNGDTYIQIELVY